MKMKMLKLSYRHRFFKICLIAIACQTGKLFSREDTAYTPYPSPWPTENTWNNFQEFHQEEKSIFPPKQAGVDKQNFIAFDPDLEEAPDKEQHPLTKEGEAKAYHFQNEILPPVVSITHEFSPSQKASSPSFAKSTDRHPADFKKNSLPVHPTISAESEEEVVAQLSTPVAAPGTSPLNSPQSTLLPLPISRPPIGVQLPSSSSDPSQSMTQSQGRTIKEISINFNNVAMIEYIHFISRISNKNFIFDDEDLQFNVTIVSEEPTTVENLMAALLQELRIRDLSLMEQGNNIIIHRNPRVRSPARIVADSTELTSSHESELITRVFRLNTLDPSKASDIIRPLLSEEALIEVLRDTNNLIITDLVTNVNKIAQLIDTLDAPNSGVTIGQYVVRNTFVDSLVDLANKILQPIAQGNPFVIVPHSVSNSIFIVSNSFIVEKALAILQNLDFNEGKTKILSLETLQPSYTFPGGRAGVPGAPGGGGPGGRSGAAPEGTAESFPFGPGGLAPSPPGGISTPGGGVSDRFGPEGFRPEGGGAGGGFGPGGQFENPEGVPESFPFGGISAEGRNAPPPLPPAPPPAPLPPPPYPFTPGALGAEGRASAIFDESRDYFYPFGPGGIGAEGRPSIIFDETRMFLPGGIGADSRFVRELPIGHIERTLFFIHRLRYRKGDNIEIALRKIANSLQVMGTANIDLISAINSIQWIESSNALIFTGTGIALEKVRELILEVDVPLRQVFIEMLILRTTITDSLSYSVDWIDRFGGGSTTGEEGFVAIPRGAGDPSVDGFIAGSESIFSGGSVCPPVQACPLPVATNLLNAGGFVAGVIGTHLTHNGTRFSTIGALVKAIHTDSKTDILLNPKIITEDNNPAEIFVGGTDRYKTQSITNDLGSLVTNNFQFIDVGTTLRVTPLIGNNNLVTLEIIQETTAATLDANNPALANSQSVNLVQVLTKARTVTKIHVPSGFFVILSGMIQDSQVRTYSRIPCLGGIPILGAFGKTQTTGDTKDNLMLFIRPIIIDTDEDYEDITRRQQDVFREKSKFRRAWNYEIDEALNFAEIKPTDPDEMDCRCSYRNQR